MAETVRFPRKGIHVYKSFSPQRAGVIIEVGEPVKYKALNGEMRDSGDVNVKVLWLTGELEDTTTRALRDFDALIQDHEKKLRTHRATKKCLEALSV